MKKGKWLEMIGNIWINGKAVHVYESEEKDKVLLIAETTGGKILKTGFGKCFRLILRKEYEENWKNYHSANKACKALRRVGYDISF